MALLLSALTMVGCASSVRPDKLSAPQNVTCVEVKEPLSFTAKRGLLHIEQETRLERGAYVSEKEDAKGTYYRAPPGGISVGRLDRKDGVPGTGVFEILDGGIFIPHDGKAAPTLYKYFSTTSATPEVPAASVNCSSVVYTRDPDTKKVNVVAVATATGLGAATGAMVGRSIRSGSHMSYGQSAGVGLVGGALGGLIVAAIINSEVGEIQPGPEIDGSMQDKIRMLAANKVRVSESGHSTAVYATTAPVTTTAGAQEAQGQNETVPMTTATPPATTTASAPVADAATASLAQNTATQMGCGLVQASGDGAYTAPCGSYSVLIGCGGSQCYPRRTISAKSDE
jgi:hypothetical protein